MQLELRVSAEAEVRAWDVLKVILEVVVPLIRGEDSFLIVLIISVSNHHNQFTNSENMLCHLGGVKQSWLQEIRREIEGSSDLLALLLDDTL